ncbi:MAG: ImuA family protein [Sphingomicrobium sp.]|nr:protein ImuA [Sphingomonadales bacterium]
MQAIQAAGRITGTQVLPFGIEAIDERLCGAGLACGALHEITGTSGNLNDDAAATLFTAGIASRCAAESGTVLWALTRRDLFAPALAQVGLRPDRLIYAECRRDEEALAVMEEGLRHGSLAAVIGEIGRMTMTATRRLELAAENSGMTALVLKRWRRSGEDPLAQPSSAVTRWRIGCVPSKPLPVSGIAQSRWRIELVRQRGGPPHQWILEGTDEAGRLAYPAEPFHRSAAADRSEAPARHAA